MAMQWERAAKMAKRRTLTEEKAREIISEILVSVYGGEGLRTYSVRKWFDHFRKIKADSRDPKTAAKYEQIEREFLEFLGHKADLNILSVTSADVRAFRDRRKATGLSATTLNMDITILSTFFNGAWRDHVISNNPCTAVSPVKDAIPAKTRRKQPFNQEQVAALLNVAQDDWKGLIGMAYFTGQRLGDVANLRFRQIDYDRKIITVEVAKTGDVIEVPMHESVENFLLSLPAPKSDEAFLFPTLAERKSGDLSKEFSRLMEAAHIDNRDIRKRGQGAARNVRAYTFHSLRHAFSSDLANAGVSEERRMALDGHKSRDVHQGYSHHEIEVLRGELSRALPSHSFALTSKEQLRRADIVKIKPIKRKR
jgi:integrase